MLDHQMHRLLLDLESAADWVSIDAVSHIPAAIRTAAVHRGFVEADGSNLSRRYRIVEAGYIALGSNAQDMLAELKQGRIPRAPEISVSVYGETLGIGSVTQSKRKRRANSGICAVEGCGQPRYKKYNRCQKHQQELKKAQNAKFNARKRKGSPVVIVEPPIDDEDTRTDLPPVQEVVETAIPESPAVSTPPPFGIRMGAAAAHLLISYYKLKGVR